MVVSPDDGVTGSPTHSASSRGASTLRPRWFAVCGILLFATTQCLPAGHPPVRARKRKSPLPGRQRAERPMKKSGNRREPPGCQYPLGCRSRQPSADHHRPFPHICRDSQPSTAKVATGLLESDSRPNARITALENMCRSASPVGSHRTFCARSGANEPECRLQQRLTGYSVPRDR